MRTVHLANPLERGDDVLAVQRLLHAHGYLTDVQVDSVFGPASGAACVRAKRRLGYPDVELLPCAGARLAGYLSGISQVPLSFRLRAKARRAEHAKAQTVRDKIVANAKWGIRNNAAIHYRQARPIDGLHRPFKLPLYTDCSGFSTLCYAWAGAPDPNGLGYSGLGYTGTLLEHMRHIPAAAAKPGDLVVFGRPPGHHVALILEPDLDPLLASHGQEVGPFAIRLSDEARYQPPAITFLSILP